MTSFHELLDPPYRRSTELVDSTGFYGQLTTALDSDLSIGRFFAVNHIYQYYYSTVRLIQYDMRLEQNQAIRDRVGEEAMAEGEFYHIGEMQRDRDWLESRRLSELHKQKNFATKNTRQFHRDSVDGRANNRAYRQTYDLWLPQRDNLGNAEFKLAMQREPQVGIQQLALTAAANIRDTVGQIRDAYRVRLLTAGMIK